MHDVLKGCGMQPHMASLERPSYVRGYSEDAASAQCRIERERVRSSDPFMFLALRSVALARDKD